MHSVRLKIDNKIFDHLLWLLRKFSKDEFEIVIEDSNLENHKQVLDTELKEVIDGNVLFYSINEIEQRVDKAISNMHVSLKDCYYDHHGSVIA